MSHFTIVVDSPVAPNVESAVDGAASPLFVCAAA